MQNTDDMMTLREVSEFFGGKERPLDQSTIYRWVSEGRIPKPVRMSPKVVRWRKSDCERVREAMRAASQEQPPKGSAR